MTTEETPGPSEASLSSGAEPRSTSTVLQPQHLYKTAGLFFLFLIFYANFAPVARVLLMVYASAIVAVALNVLVGLIPRHRRLVSVALGLVIFGGLVLTLWVAVPALAGQLRSLAAEIPRLEDQLEEWSAWLREQTGMNVELYGEQTRAMFSEIIGGAEALGSAWGVIEGVFLPFLLLVGALYAVAKPNELLLSPLLHVIPRERRDSFRRVFMLLGDRLKGWVKGTLLGMLAVGVLTGLGLWLIGVRYALLLALISALLEIVPILGPWVAGAIAVAVAFIDDPTKAIWVVLLMLAVQQLETNLITPLVMAQVAEVHPFITLFALIFFGSIFGFLGVILALPLVLLTWTLVEVLWVERAIKAEGDRIEPIVKDA
jgi:predicted PurR-regulated permease PerM